MGAVPIGRHGEVVFSSDYGMANLEHGVPNTSATKFRLGSVTKQFTAAAILQLQAQSRLGVNASIAQYILVTKKAGLSLHPTCETRYF